jgi:hypothetical protein
MRTMHGQGGIAIHHYEAGDLVRLRRDEDGPLVTAFAGDWGRVLRVHPDGALDIKLAGYSRAKDAALIKAVAVARRHVEPCDANGRPLARDLAPVWDTRGRPAG